MFGFPGNTGFPDSSRGFTQDFIRWRMSKARTCVSKILKLFVAMAAWPCALAVCHGCEPYIPDCRCRPVLGYAAVLLLRPSAPSDLRSCRSSAVFNAKGWLRGFHPEA